MVEEVMEDDALRSAPFKTDSGRFEAAGEWSEPSILRNSPVFIDFGSYWGLYCI